MARLFLLGSAGDQVSAVLGVRPCLQPNKDGTSCATLFLIGKNKISFCHREGLLKGVVATKCATLLAIEMKLVLYIFHRPRNAVQDSTVPSVTRVRAVSRIPAAAEDR